LRINKTKYFFLGCGMIKFWYGMPNLGVLALFTQGGGGVTWGRPYVRNKKAHILLWPTLIKRQMVMPNKTGTYHKNNNPLFVL